MTSLSTSSGITTGTSTRTTIALRKMQAGGSNGSSGGGGGVFFANARNSYADADGAIAESSSSVSMTRSFDSVDSEIEVFDFGRGVDSSEMDTRPKKSRILWNHWNGSEKDVSVRSRLVDPVTLRARREERPGDNLARNVALTLSIFSTVYTTYLIASSNPRSLSWFAYHPPLQMATLTLFTLGILTLQPATQTKTKAAGLVRHQICMLLAGAPLLAAGTWVIYHSKEVKARKHFTSWHGTIGIVAVAWLIIQVFIGCASVWFGGIVLGGSKKAKSVRKYHRLSGYVVYSLLLFSAHRGGASSTFTGTHASNVMRIIVYYVSPIIIALAVYSRIRPAKMKLF